MSKIIPQMTNNCSTEGKVKYLTTESSEEFDKEYQILFGDRVQSETVVI